ncbi:hypothetical protein ABIB25_000535 [Nakamurella sp. UYEF19]|uniref:glycoside hydrolase family 16 protein n=1 Tax=Nakamurella sp. UYEF19 TaxID=1756392 RepID=UPI0033911A7D
MRRTGTRRTRRYAGGAAAALLVLLSACTSPSADSITTAVPAPSVSAPVSSSAAPTASSAASSEPAQGVDPSLTRVSLDAQVRGGTVTATAVIAAAPAATFDRVGVCARNASGGVVDFPFARSAAVSAVGTSFTVSRTLLPGSYQYWSCAKLGENWHDIGPRKTVVVTSTVSPNAAGSASGQPMPVGDLPGWRQIFTDDFTTDVPMGGFPGPYADKWAGYDGFPDTSGDGAYAQRILSVHDGVLDMFLHTENGVPLGAAPVPLIRQDGQWGGQVYGRYVIRFKSDPLPGYGTGWLLWPDSGDWNEGEIDFPEGALDKEMEAFNHCIGNPHDKCLVADTTTTYTQWHTATIDWRPERLSFVLDGKTIASTTDNIPKTPMRWTLQTATNGHKPAADVAGHLLIDWVAIYALD